MTTEPKPVKPLVAFAAVRDGVIHGWSVNMYAYQVRNVVGDNCHGGWADAKRSGFRVIKVRIEPVEE